MKHFITKSDARHHVVNELRAAALDHAKTLLWIRGGRFIPVKDEALIEDYLRAWCERQDMREALKWLDYDNEQLCKLFGFAADRAMSSVAF